MISALIVFSALHIGITALRTSTFTNQCSMRPSSDDLSYVYKELYVRHQIECAAVCQREEECSAVTYNKTSKLCSLVSDVERNCFDVSPNNGSTDGIKYLEKVCLFH